MSEAKTLLEQIEPADPVQFGIFRQLEPPKEIYFYERIEDPFASQNEFKGMGEAFEATGGEKIIACSEAEASWFHHPQRRVKFRQVGVSDGKAYYLTFKNSGYKIGQRVPIDEIRALMKKAFAAELEVARGKFKMPRRNNVNIMGDVSQDTIKAMERGQL